MAACRAGADGSLARSVAHRKSAVRSRAARSGRQPAPGVVRQGKGRSKPVCGNLPASRFERATAKIGKLIYPLSLVHDTSRSGQL